jgi:hypothetical protein
LAGVAAINDMIEFGDLLVMATSAETENAFLHTQYVFSKAGVIACEIPHSRLLGNRRASEVE